VELPPFNFETYRAETQGKSEALAARVMGLKEDEARALVEEAGHVFRVLYRYPDESAVWHSDYRAYRVNVMLDLWSRVGVTAVG
jgi:hypothetical protein